MADADQSGYGGDKPRHEETRGRKRKYQGKVEADAAAKLQKRQAYQRNKGRTNREVEILLRRNSWYAFTNVGFIDCPTG